MPVVRQLVGLCGKWELPGGHLVRSLSWWPKALGCPALIIAIHCVLKAFFWRRKCDFRQAMTGSRDKGVWDRASPTVTPTTTPEYIHDSRRDVILRLAFGCPVSTALGPSHLTPFFLPREGAGPFHGSTFPRPSPTPFVKFCRARFPLLPGLECSGIRVECGRAPSARFARFHACATAATAFIIGPRSSGSLDPAHILTL